MVDARLLDIGSQISHLLAGAEMSRRYMEYFVSLARKNRLEESVCESDGVRRVIKALKHLDLSHVSRVYLVDPDYYSWPLYRRALCMTAPSPAHLCKSVIFENKRWRPDTNGYNRYYCVLVQYVHTIDTSKMIDYVRMELNSMNMPPSPRKHFNFRLVAPEVSFDLTGFGNNAVCPIGMTAKDMPIVLCQSISQLRPPVFWLGAGHVDYKLAMPVADFVNATKCHLADISTPVT